VLGFEELFSIGELQYCRADERWTRANIPTTAARHFDDATADPAHRDRAGYIPIMHERILGNSEVMRYVFQGVPMTVERAGQVMRKFFTFGESLTGIAILAEKPAAEIIGFAGLFPTEVLGADDFEIGFVLARRAWGRALPPRSARPNLHSGSSSSTAGDCLD
jgi:hypothetical protein